MDYAELELWQAFSDRGDLSAREELVLKYMALANYAVSRCHAARACDSFEDAISEAYLVLVQCVDRFDYTRGNSFSTLAVPRIIGAIKDLARAARGTIRSKSGPEITFTPFSALCEEEVQLFSREEYYSNEDEIACGKLMLSLPLGWRCFILLRVLEGFSHAEVCKHLGFSMARSLHLVGLIRKRLLTFRKEGDWPWASPD